jgi:hypothetical protein
VTLPTATAGRRIIIVNRGANSVNVYPATGGNIDALAANASIALPVNGWMEFNASSTTQWYSSYYITSSGGGMVYPGAGIAVSTGSAWTTSLTAPSGTIVGTTDTQTLTNKTLALEAYSTAATVTAGTNAQGQGPLTNDINVVTTTAANPSGVTLPTAFAGAKVFVINKGTNPVNVYPASGATINGSSSSTLQVGVTLTFIAISTTAWYTVSGFSTVGNFPTSLGGTGLGGSSPFSTGGAVYATSASALTTGTLPVSGGGTGSASAPTIGQLLIGNGTTFSLNTITAGSGITVTNGSGTITIAASGGGGGGAFSLVGSYGVGPYTGSPPFSLASMGTFTSNAGRYMIVLDGINTSSFGSTSVGLVFGSSGSSAITSGYLYTSVIGATNNTSPYTPSGYANGFSSGSYFPLTVGAFGLQGGGFPPYILSGWIEVVVSYPAGSTSQTWQVYGKLTYVSSTGAPNTYTTVELNGVLPTISLASAPYFGLYCSSSLSGTAYVYQVT